MTTLQKQAPYIAGVGCRFPGAGSAARFWQNLNQGVSSITEAPASRFAKVGLEGTPEFRGGFVEDIEFFDAEYFGIAPREAASMDPQQCLALETTAAALADAALAPADIAELNVGVFAAASLHDYSVLRWSGHGDGFAITGSANSAVANRVSYWLNARGPSVSFDTACSSSLTAAHFACQSIELGECDLAVVVGVSAMLLPAVTQRLVDAGVVTAQTVSKTFDANAGGYLRGEGGGAMILVSPRCAADLGLSAYARVAAHAINHGGRSNGFAAPNPWAQAAVVQSAYQRAELSTAQVAYIEAMGASTRLGDQLELKSLSKALAAPARTAPCTVGSLKPNIGHLEAASGIASLIKLALGVYFQRLPAMCTVDELNPAFVKLKDQVRLADQPTDLSRDALVGANSFALGGSNAHIALGHAGDLAKTSAAAATRGVDGRVLCLSATTRSGLARVAASFARIFNDRPEVFDATVDKSLWGTANQAHRAVIIGVSGNDIASALGDADEGFGADRPLHITQSASRDSVASVSSALSAAAQAYLDGQDGPLKERAVDRHTTSAWLPVYPFERTLDTTASLTHGRGGGVDNAELDPLLEALRAELDGRGV